MTSPLINRSKAFSQRLVDLETNSPWSKSHYTTDILIHEALQYILRFGPGDGAYNQKAWETFIPEFQRGSDKWTNPMRRSFVENLILGYKDSVISLFLLESDYKKQGYLGCQILDGLQRLTALKDFLLGDLDVFRGLREELNDSKPITYKTLLNKTGAINMTKTIKLRIYRFGTLEEVVRFYVQMNENITHSSGDIDRAKDYLSTLSSPH